MYGPIDDIRIHQGDIFKDLQFQYVTKDDSTARVTFPFWVVLTQDCDLEQDINALKKLPQVTQDKYLQTVLVCPAFISDQLKEGLHMSQLNWSMQKWTSDLWKPIKRNRESRFHTLKGSEEFEFPDLVMDFKRFFTLPREYVYENLQNRVAAVDDLYREAISQRFAYYLSRIALPEASEASV